MIPAALRSIGVTSSTPPEELARIRAERQNHVQRLDQTTRDRNAKLADYIEQHPEILAPTLQRVTTLLASPSHIRLHWALTLWQQALEGRDAHEIANIFRDTTEATRDLRETAPFAGEDIAKL
jgi:hypothetical protein